MGTGKQPHMQISNPLDNPQAIAEALRERHNATRVLIRIEGSGSFINYEAKE